ncbi:MAG: hydrogenase iron-sulfur subunit [Phycisphaerae bacterium]|nr:hydrogenase iron-sulfur subunit [Phycisphaerae bacterium]
MSDGNQQPGQEPEVVLLYCQHGLCHEAKGSAWYQECAGLSIRAIMMPCSSKIEVSYILKLLESGADAVEVVACPEKSCKYLVGSLRAERRIEYVRGLLEKIGYAPERVGISRKLSQSPVQLMDLARARADAVRSFGINPMKKGE